VRSSTAQRDDAVPTVNGSAAVPPPAVRNPLPTRQRRPGYTALGLLLVVGLAGVFGYLYSTAGSKVPVVVVQMTVPVGGVIERSDLSLVEVAGDLTAIAGANLDSVVGQRAAVGLLPGTVLQRSMLTGVDPTPPGLVQVGVAVKGGQIPADGVSPGDTVQVLRLLAAGTGDAAVPVVVAAEATVYASVPDPTQAGSTLLTLLVPAEQAAAVAGASGAAAAAVLKVPAS
jgi:hypothetical protein